jgi:hypothetical protein
VPDALVVVEDGAVAGEEAAAGRVEHTHPLPALLILVHLVNHVLHALGAVQHVMRSKTFPLRAECSTGLSQTEEAERISRYHITQDVQRGVSLRLMYSNGASMCAGFL